MIELGADEFSGERDRVRQIRADAKARQLPDPYRAFMKHAAHAKARGVEWRFGFLEWWEIWEPHYHLRGSGPDDLVMGRKGDVGPYAPGNVYLTTGKQNMDDYRGSPKKAADLESLKKRRRQNLVDMAAEINAFYATWHGPKLPPEEFIRRRCAQSETSSLAQGLPN